MEHVTLTVRDIRSYRLMCRISCWFGIVPWLTSSYKVIDPIFQKMLSFVVTMSLAAYTSYNIYLRINYDRSIIGVTSHILTITSEVLICTVTISALLNGTYLKHSKWTRMFSILSDFNEEVFVSRKIKFSSILYNVTFYYCLHMIFCVFYLTVTSLAAIHSYELDLFKLRVIVSVHNFIFMQTTFLYLSLVFAFYVRYKDLNVVLESQYDATATEKVNKFTTKSSKNNAAVDTEVLETLGKYYTSISKATEHFNSIFGWQILFIFAYFMIAILTFVNYFLVKSKNAADAAVNNAEVSTAGSLDIIYVSVASIITSLSCDLTTQEGAEFIKICYKLEQEYPKDSEVRKALIRIAGNAETCTPRFSAADFFDIDKGTLMSFLGTTTTYFIVVIQFNNTF